MNLDLSSADVRRSAGTYGQIAAQELIRLFRILESTPTPGSWIQFQGPNVPFSGRKQGFEG